MADRSLIEWTDRTWSVLMTRMGSKKAAGRVLDGRTFDEFPREVTP